jgi:hypothetical protein
MWQVGRISIARIDVSLQSRCSNLNADMDPDEEEGISFFEFRQSMLQVYYSATSRRHHDHDLGIFCVHVLGCGPPGKQFDCHRDGTKK